MKNICIVVPDFAVMQAIADPRYMFSAANMLLEEAGKEPLFNVQLVATNAQVALEGGLYLVNPDLLITDSFKADLIIIPAIGGDILNSIQANRKYHDWILTQVANGAEIASLCLGAFILADTGLVNGKKCSTHWLFADLFRSLYPQVTLVNQKIISDECGIYSSGGANSYWNLLLYLVEKYAGRDIAVKASKFFVIETMRNNQSPFIIFKAQKTHTDEEVKVVQDAIEQEYSNNINLDELSLRFALSRRTLERRFKAATNNTIAAYIQRVRVEAAKKYFETSNETVSQVMYSVGYSDSKAFRAVFKKLTGLAPSDYRNKYAR